jgi:hypothetical protein
MRFAILFLAGCTFTSPVDTDPLSGLNECIVQCRDAGAKHMEYTSGIGYERCACTRDAGAE